MSTTTLQSATKRAAEALDVAGLRRQFPILGRAARDRPLVYLDNAATSQKPQAVIDALLRFYTEDCSNIHRGAHLLGQRASEAYDAARVRVQRFLGAGSDSEIIFVRGTTEAINLVAQAFGTRHLEPGQEIIISTLEHHANIVPWQMLCQRRGTRLRIVPVDETGQLVMDAYERLLGPRTGLVAVTHASNALGTVTPLREIIALAHRQGVPVLVDGAQAVPHRRVDVSQLDCDFYAFSGHKVFGPTGIGVLYAKRRWLEAMPPYQGGGGMISSVRFQGTTYADPPHKFEAGTPHIAGAIALGAAIDFLDQYSGRAIEEYEQQLLEYATQSLASVPGLRIIGTAPDKVPILSFVLQGIHPHDVGTILDRYGIATRTGHHCAQPLMERFGVPATTRASLAMYNTHHEIDALIDALHKVNEVFR